METDSAIKNRHSRRTFLPKEVEWEKIVEVLDAARLAPSAMNSQPWHYVVVKEKERISSIIQAGPFFNNWMRGAPVLIVACVKGGQYSQIDLGLSIENLLLRATDLGLATCPTAVGNKEKTSKIIRCPAEYTPMITIAIGYAKEKKSLGERAMALMKKKKELGQIASMEEFGRRLEEKQ